MIFISYRRKDIGSWIAERIAQQLTLTFGNKTVFYDNQSVISGEKWSYVIDAALQTSDVFIILIGKNWFCEELNDPSDWVRHELRTALRKISYIIPIYLDGSTIITPNKIPEDINDICSIQGLFIDTRSDEILKVSLDIVANKIKLYLNNKNIEFKNNTTCEVTFKLSNHVLITKLCNSEWDVFNNNILIYKLTLRNPQASVILDIGVQNLMVKYNDKAESRDPRGIIPGTGLRGQTEVFKTNLGPGKYTFTLFPGKSTRSILQKIKDNFLYIDKTPMYIKQISYEAWN